MATEIPDDGSFSITNTARPTGGTRPDNPPRGTPRSNRVTLIIDGKIWSGWTAVRIGRGVERLPSDFEVALTESYPGEGQTLTVQPGSTCVVKIGDDVIITGAVDRYTPAITPSNHEVRIQRPKPLRRLVDCSAGIRAV